MSQAPWWRHLRGDPSRFLLDDEQPGVVWMTLTEVLGRPEDSPAVARSRQEARVRGDAAALWAAQEEGGWWGSPAAYAARWSGTAWRLIAAASLGADPQDPRAALATEALMQVLEPRQGGFAPGRGRPPAACFTAELCDALVRFGFGHEARVREAVAWLVERELVRGGGWSCPDLRHLVDGGCPVAASGALRLAAHLGQAGQQISRRLAERASQWLIERNLFLEGQAPRGWFVSSHPALGRTDLLDALYGLARCGVPANGAVRAGLARVLAEQSAEGRWTQRRKVPGGETTGEPSRWLTFKALVVIAAYGTDEEEEA